MFLARFAKPFWGITFPSSFSDSGSPRSVPDIIVKSFEDLYTQHPDLFEATLATLIPSRDGMAHGEPGSSGWNGVNLC